MRGGGELARPALARVGTVGSVTTTPPDADLRGRLQSALTEARKARDRDAADALRSALGAIDNAEAVDTVGRPSVAESNSDIAGATQGAGSSDVARRELTPDDVAAIVRSQIAELDRAVDEYRVAGQSEAAERLRRGADALRAVVEA